MTQQDLLNGENKLTTRMGAAFLGDRVIFRGKDLHKQLNSLSWMELFLYSVTGRFFPPEEVKILNILWTCTSYPEPRLWPNRIVALAGSVRSTPYLSLSAGVAVSEANIYGGRPNVGAIDFLLRAKQALDKGEELSKFVERELRRDRIVYGYGRPLAREDERIPYLLQVLKELGMEGGEYVRLAFEVERILKRKRRQFGLMNAAALAAAIAADLGFTAREYHNFMTFSFVAGMMPCFIEASEKPEGSFFPLRCTSVVYQGASKRNWDNEIAS